MAWDHLKGHLISLFNGRLSAWPSTRSLNQKPSVKNKTFFLFYSNTNIITIHVGCTEYLELWEMKTQAPPHACAVRGVTVTDTEIKPLIRLINVAAGRM